MPRIWPARLFDGCGWPAPVSRARDSGSRTSPSGNRCSRRASPACPITRHHRVSALRQTQTRRQSRQFQGPDFASFQHAFMGNSPNRRSHEVRRPGGEIYVVNVLDPTRVEDLPEHRAFGFHPVGRHGVVIGIDYADALKAIRRRRKGRRGIWERQHIAQRHSGRPLQPRSEQEVNAMSHACQDRANCRWPWTR